MAGTDESNGTACGGRLRRSDYITIDGTTIWSVIGAILITLVVACVTEAAASFAAAEVTGLPPVLLPALGVSARIAAQVVPGHHAAERRQRENQFYFVYEADRTLAES